MPIFIAKNYDGRVESIVLAKSYELAQAFWQGKEIYPHSIDTRSEDDLTDHITGVLPMLKTQTITASRSGCSPREFLVVSKG